MGFMQPKAWSQCAEAREGSVTIFIFDLNAPDFSHSELYSFLEDLQYKLNSEIYQKLSSEGLLKKTYFHVQWCPGDPVTDPNVAANKGKKWNSSGVMWGSVDRASGELKSQTKMTAVTDKPITGVCNVVFENNIRKLVDDSYVAFGAYVLGKVYYQQRDMPMARKCFKFAQRLKKLPDRLLADLNETVSAIDGNSAAKQLSSIAKGGK